MFFDLASLTKCLVTAPLALLHLDLDADRRAQLGFSNWPTPLTVRQLLSHSSGLPPWLPFTGEPLAVQLSRGFPENSHPLLRRGMAGVSLYSDLGYRLLAELLEMETGRDFCALGHELTGLAHAPWNDAPVSLPDAQDADAWRIAELGLPFPEQGPGLAHDANARAGMKGHAGFGATPAMLEAWLPTWLKDFAPQMAVPQAKAEDGRIWGLGLHAPQPEFLPLLARWGRAGVHVLWRAPEAGTVPERETRDVQGNEGKPGKELQSSDTPAASLGASFWMHTGFTGPALFVRPETGTCIALLLDRLGEDGTLLDGKGLTARRMGLLG